MNGYFYRQSPVLGPMPDPWSPVLGPVPHPWTPERPPDPYAHPYSIPTQHFQSYQQYHQY
ncbi:hypothetical protein CU072_30320 [Bacillus thuringiensis]|uniref:hypothetical protein n=1 Tax=Bacillus thuringiensis TaxID=1428 RepID=UPI000D6D6160|nr:hypothetical protein [Bacillus thuringiensis]PWN11882.1 hypothetical protein CU072_30320 [Bacillus thuringiensis]